MVSRSQPRPSGTWSFRTEPHDHPDLPFVTSPTIRSSHPLPHIGRVNPSRDSEETTPPKPAPERTSSVLKTNPRFFNRGNSLRDAHSKDKRKKLVKKSLSQPTFEMLNPTRVRSDAAEEAKATQLDEQLAELIAEIEQETAGEDKNLTFTSNTPLGLTTWTEKEKQFAPPRKSYLRPTPEDEERRAARHWSQVPLLPELDFNSSGSESSLLFDPETHSPPPSATVHISTMVSMNMGSIDLKHTSSDPDKLTYRCDIHAENGASHRAVEEACQEVVTNAGGRILDSYFYPGGFLCSLPPGILEPLTTCELPMHAARIEVNGWTAFPQAKLNGLAMHPPSGKLGGERPWSLSTMDEGLNLRRDTGVDLVDAWTKSEGVALIVDPPAPAEKREEAKHEKEGVENKTYKAPETPITTPTRKPALMKSLETLRRRAARSISGISPPPLPIPFSAKKSPGPSNENRYTVVLDRSMSRSEGEGESGSGAEDWESVRSELQT